MRGSHWQLAALSAASLLLVACRGEDRPRVDLIGEGVPSVSVSATGEVATPVGGGYDVPGRLYKPDSDIAAFHAVAFDLREMRMLMTPGLGQPVNWQAVIAVYEQGRTSGAQTRPLASLADASDDALIRSGLQGAGQAQGWPDEARRVLVDRAALTVLADFALRNLTTARERIEARNLAGTTGAPRAIDEAWAALAGPVDGTGVLSSSVIAVSSLREENFKLQEKLAVPLEKAFIAAQAAARQGNLGTYDPAAAQIRGYVYATFYLSVLRAAKTAETATTPEARHAALAEGWAYFQALRGAVAAASPGAAQALNASLSADAALPFPVSETVRVYQALNEAVVLQALGIPAALQVITPPRA